MPNFKSQGFRMKEMYVIRLFIFAKTFFASDDSEIQARVKDFRPVHEDVLFLYVNKVFHTYFVVYGSFIFQNINFQS